MQEGGTRRHRGAGCEGVRGDAGTDAEGGIQVVGVQRVGHRDAEGSRTHSRTAPTPEVTCARTNACTHAHRKLKKRGQRHRVVSQSENEGRGR